MSVRLLKEYIEAFLVEYEGGGAAETYANAGITASDIAGASGHGYGGSFGSGSDLKAAFITPFTDVFKTAIGKAKEVSVEARTLVTVALLSALTVIIPFLGVKYDKIFEKEKKDLEKIKSKYKDVYDRTNRALQSNDAAFLAFMADPKAVLSLWGASKAPAVMSDILSVVTLGASDALYDKIKNLNLPDKIEYSDEKTKKKRKKSVSSSREDLVSDWFLREEKQGSNEDEFKRKVYSDQEFINRVTDNKHLEEMRKYSIVLYKRSLTQVYEQLDELFNKVKTAEDLERFLKGKHVPELEKIKELQGEEKKKAEKFLLGGIKGAMKKYYIKSLEQHLNSVVSAGIPRDSQYVKDYKEAIQKIKSLR